MERDPKKMREAFMANDVESRIRGFTSIFYKDIHELGEISTKTAWEHTEEEVFDARKRLAWIFDIAHTKFHLDNPEINEVINRSEQRWKEEQDAQGENDGGDPEGA